MRCLLDTHVLIWSIARSLRPPSGLRALLAYPAREVFFRAASFGPIPCFPVTAGL